MGSGRHTVLTNGENFTACFRRIKAKSFPIFKFPRVAFGCRITFFAPIFCSAPSSLKRLCSPNRLKSKVVINSGKIVFDLFTQGNRKLRNVTSYKNISSSPLRNSFKLKYRVVRLYNQLLIVLFFFTSDIVKRQLFKQNNMRNNICLSGTRLPIAEKLQRLQSVRVHISF